MCDRTKTEVLARELAFHRYTGMKVGHIRTLTHKEYQEFDNYMGDYTNYFMKEARRILKSLAVHKDEEEL